MLSEDILESEALEGRFVMTNGMAVLAGNANPQLARLIAERLGTALTDVLVGRFSEGEIRVQVKDNIRGKDVFIVQPTCPPTNDNLMELLIMIDAARRASAQRITAVLPYYGYARQDRKDQPRVPISAKLVANLIVASGANRVLTMDLHASQIQGFFDIPVDHLYAINALCEYFSQKSIDRDRLVVVTSDVGGIKMARAYAKRLGVALAVVDKRRYSPEKTEVMHILGDVKGKTAVIVDDIVATAGSLVEAAEALKKEGCEKILAAVSHGVLSGPALDRIKACAALEEVVITDSIPFTREDQHPKIKVVSIAPLLAEAIKRIHNEQSVSSLFE